MFKDFDNMDKMARDAFENFEVDFNPEDWKRMEAKLDKKEHLMPNILLFKGIEAALLLLVVFTALHFWYSGTNNVNVASNDTNASHEGKNSQTFVPGQQNTSASNQSTNNTFSMLENGNNSNTTNAAENNLGTNPEGANSNTGTQSKGAKTGNHNNNANNVYNGTSTITNSNNNGSGHFGNNANSNTTPGTGTNKSSTTNTVNNSNKIAPLKTSVNRTAIQEKLAVNKAKANASSDNSNNNNTIGAVNTEMNSNNSNSENVPTTVTTDKDNTMSNELVTPILLKDNKLNHGGDGDGDGNTVEEGNLLTLKNKFAGIKLYRRMMRVSVLGGSDINLGNSLGDFNFGFSMGVLAEQEISDRFSFRFGAMFSRKSYDNYFTKVIDHSATEGIIYESKITQKTALSVVSVPFYLNYKVFRDPSWKIGVNLGFAPNFLSHRFVSGEQRTVTQQASGSVTSISDLNPNTFEKGLLQGGAFKGNFYITAAMGVDIERRLGNRVSLFLQPMYHHALMGVGSDKVKLHHVSLNVGIRALVK